MAEEEKLEVVGESKKRYTILSFIIGRDYELLHEVKCPQDDVEYLMVTDDPELQSKTWRVVFDEDLLKLETPFERCFAVRYNVFKYASTDLCFTIDGSIEVSGSLDALAQKMEDGKYDFCLMPHPLWPDFQSEYAAWMKMRKYPVENTMRFAEFLQKANYNASYKGLFQLCFSGKRRCKVVEAADAMTMAVLKWLSLPFDSFERLDQTVFTYVMNRYFSDARVLPVSEQAVRSYALTWFWHKSTMKNENVFYDISKPDIKWMFNKQVECMYLK